MRVLEGGVTERPIIFSDAMVRAILAGTKTQTRRMVRPQPVAWSAQDDLQTLPFVEHGEIRRLARWGSRPVPCPYGGIGDRLWVREAWRCVGLNDDWTRATIELRAGPGRGWTSHDVDPDAPTTERIYNRARPYFDDDGVLRRDAPWRPSIYMPRWASRITLELTDVRAQRLHDISEEDARAEGVIPGACDLPAPWVALNAEFDAAHTLAFSALWDSINAARAPWASNPWVWALTFKVAAP